MQLTLHLKRVRFHWIAAAVLLAALLALINWKLVYRPDLPRGDFFAFWLAGFMTGSGQDPYSNAQWLAGNQFFQQVWISNPAFIYPLPLAVMLIPLAWLPLGTAYIAWITLAELMVVAAAVLAFDPARRPEVRPYLLPFLAGCFLFRATVVTFRNGQLGALLLFCLALAWFFFERERWFTGGICLAFLALKPPLGILLPGMLAVWFLQQRRWRAIAGLAAGGVGLLVLGMANDPNWVAGFLTQGAHLLARFFGYSPTVWGLAGAACGNQMTCTLISGGLASLVLLAGFAGLLLRRRRDLSPAALISIAVPVALLLVPYIWAYDQILLILPLAFVVRRLAQRGKPFLLGATLMILVGVAALVLLVISDGLQRDYWSALVPLGVLALVAWEALILDPKGL